MKPRAKERQARRGFTLIELLTVIAIITILAGLLFPVIAGVQESARQGRCMTNMRTLVQALKMYKDDWRVFPEALYGLSYDGQTIVPALYPQYVTSEEDFHCPNSPVEANDRTLVDAQNLTTGVFTGQRPVNPYLLVALSSYDSQFRPYRVSPLPQFTELHYARKWTAEPPGLGDPGGIRQLLYRNPPDSTVVTWCHYHTDMDAQGNAPYNANVIIAYLGGQVQKRAISQLIPWSATGGPWLTEPKP